LCVERDLHLGPHRPSVTRRNLVAPDPGDLRHALRDLLAQPAVGFPLMERVVYQQMAALDQRHWWYRARREVLAALIRRLIEPSADARILEIGCGTGHNLAMLGEFGHVDALELDEEARTFAEQRLGRSVLSAPLPELAGVLDT